MEVKSSVSSPSIVDSSQKDKRHTHVFFFCFLFSPGLLTDTAAHELFTPFMSLHRHKEG